MEEIKVKKLENDRFSLYIPLRNTNFTIELSRTRLLELLKKIKQIL